ncbi:hypothetical protein E2562_007698 [Oryza meyeriana var. granulata]|uniref:Uncharacterized protein n=1 Tax=Oryza meyeriana var. granulata TaxID=110450 RepID=A0A6G1EGF1_9ORYZ|nr:hypothetical protein E2562_007698 [Oryza meyeriana var. granulata]
MSETMQSDVMMYTFFPPTGCVRRPPEAKDASAGVAAERITVQLTTPIDARCLPPCGACLPWSPASRDVQGVRCRRLDGVAARFSPGVSPSPNPGATATPRVVVNTTALGNAPASARWCGGGEAQRRGLPRRRLPRRHAWLLGPRKYETD